MNREKSLVKNTGILAIGQLSSKVFTFLLLPLYTAKLAQDDFGTIDALQTAISFALYFVTLQLETAVFRFLVDERDNQKESAEYITTALGVIGLSSLLATGIILAVWLLFRLPYLLLFILGIWSQAFYFSFSNVVRGFGRNADYSIASFLVTLTSLLMNLVLILGFDIGGVSILIAMVASNFAGALFIFCREKLWHFIKRSYFDRSKLKQMLSYSLPLIPNAVSWWVANMSDRLLIIAFLGAAANGIYAAANKIPTIYTTIFSVFNLAWAESVSLAMKDADKKEYINSTYESSVKLFSFLNLGIICCSSLFFNLLIGPNYGEAYLHVYILLVAIFFNSLCSMLGGILTGYKNSKIIGLSTICGAILNFVVNIALIRSIGLYAASFSTLASYLAIWLLRHRSVGRYVKLRLNRGFLLQLLAVWMLVSAAYFVRALWANLAVLLILIAWGLYTNKKLLLSFKEMLEKKLGRGGRAYE